MSRSTTSQKQSSQKPDGFTLFRPPPFPAKPCCVYGGFLLVILLENNFLGFQFFCVVCKVLRCFWFFNWDFNFNFDCCVCLENLLCRMNIMGFWIRIEVAKMNCKKKVNHCNLTDFIKKRRWWRFYFFLTNFLWRFIFYL
jgi:hypothetical protein